MKKIVPFIILFIVPIALFAQRDLYVINDNFNDNSYNWSLTNDKEISEKIKNGHLYIKNKTYQYNYRVWNSLNINESQDFTIEAKIKLISGTKFSEYGLSWNAYGWSNSMQFIINSTGQYQVSRYSEGKEYVLLSGSNSAINGKGKYNIFKVVKQNNKYKFYINGKLLGSSQYYKKDGNKYGFYIDPAAEIAIDYFKIKQDLGNLNVKQDIVKVKKKIPITVINTDHSEIAPVISPDGKTLYFARSQKPFYLSFGDDSNFDIWYTTKKGNHWSKPKKLNAKWNNAGDNVVISVSPDNNALLIEGLYRSDGSYISDKGISITYKQKDGSWSVPKQVKIQNYINNGIYETFCPSVDRNVLILAVTRPEGYGGEDLYVSFRQSDGSYSKPKNLGSTINTFGDEATPFLAPDGKTLYFSSDGLPGYGSMDIFMTKRLDDTWQHWSKPVNLGPPINTKDWDTYFTIDAQGKYAYMSKATPTGGEDIFMIELEPENRPEPVAIISGKVLDKKTHKPLQANIEYEDFNTGKNLGIAISNPADGSYKVVLNLGKKYRLLAKKDKYITISETIDLTNVKKYQEIEKNLYLAPIEVGSVITLNNVLFRRGTAQLLPSAYPELKRLVEFLKANPNVKIMLMGHTNNIGDRQKLIELSKKRVETVKKYLIDHGIEASRISGKGYGPDKPIASNATPEGRQKNQRVEFKIINK